MWRNRPFTDFRLLILKLNVLQELFPFKMEKGVLIHAMFNENNIFFSNNMFIILIL